ncbi:DHA2 family efflux MFS transporter permease subunit [Embleya sp. MST-111070]|uniref:MFS transporter n=1 Tax=Embleya sp. MST-111070 TaxID=3398231 RepID=UPI003F73518D
MENHRNPRRWLILIVLCLSTLVLVVDNMVLTVSVPPIATDLGANAQEIQWIIESYVLVFAGLLLTAGSLSDRFGRRRIMIVGLAIFGGASLAATFAANPEQLIAGRVLMGIGGALIMPSTLSILITVFDDEERRKAITAWSAVAMVGLVGGPVVGGVLIAHFWWGAVFLINVPIAIVAIIAALVLMPESKGPWRRSDPLGMGLSMVGMTSLVWTIIESANGGLSHPGTRISLVVAVVALVAFGFWETRTAHPMVPLALFRNRVFSGASFSLVLLTFANGGLMLILTQYLQFVLGYSPSKTGLAFAPMAVASLLFNGIGATLGNRIGNRPMTAVGLVVIAVGFGTVASLPSDAGFALLSAATVLIGIGSGLAMPAATAALMGAVPAEHAGVGSALNDTVQQAGAALGVAVLGSILSGTYTGAMPDTAPEQAKQSISDALTMADTAGDHHLANTAREAFTTAMSAGFWTAATCILAAAALALLLIRDQTGSSEAAGAGAETERRGAGGRGTGAETERTGAEGRGTGAETERTGAEGRGTGAETERTGAEGQGTGAEGQGTGAGTVGAVAGSVKAVGAVAESVKVIGAVAEGMGAVAARAVGTVAEGAQSEGSVATGPVGTVAGSAKAHSEGKRAEAEGAVGARTEDAPSKSEGTGAMAAGAVAAEVANPEGGEAQPASAEPAPAWAAVAH